MGIIAAGERLAKQKLEAFERLQPKFEASSGERSWKVAVPTEPMRPFAEHVIAGYLELILPTHNNIMAHRFVDRPERNDVARE